MWLLPSADPITPELALRVMTKGSVANVKWEWTERTGQVLWNNPVCINCCLWRWVQHLFFWPLYGFIDRTASEMTGNRMRWRGSVARSKGPQPGTWAWGHCSEDKAAVHGTAVLPTELICTWSTELYSRRWKLGQIQISVILKKDLIQYDHKLYWHRVSMSLWCHGHLRCVKNVK